MCVCVCVCVCVRGVGSSEIFVHKMDRYGNTYRSLMMSTISAYGTILFEVHLLPSNGIHSMKRTSTGQSLVICTKSQSSSSLKFFITTPEKYGNDMEPLVLVNTRSGRNTTGQGQRHVRSGTPLTHSPRRPCFVMSPGVTHWTSVHWHT